MSDRRRGRLVWLGLFACMAVVFLYFVPYFPSLNNPNENSRIYQVRAAVELHKFGINEQIERYGMTNDLAERDGVFLMAKAPGTTLLGVPIYAAVHWIEGLLGHPVAGQFRLVYSLRLLGTILPTLLFLYLFRRFIRSVSGSDAIANALAIVLGTGTMILPYALIYVNHTLTAACSFGCVMAVHAVMQAKGERPLRPAGWQMFWWSSVAGFLCGMNASLDYAMLPVSIFLLAYALVRIGVGWAPLLGMAAGGLIPSVATGWFHKVCWGSPFKLSLDYLSNPAFHTQHHRGMFGIVGPTKETAWAVLFSQTKGLLYFSPVIAACFFAVGLAPVFSRWRKEAVICAIVTGWLVLYNVSLINWHAGWTVGPRYTTAMLPFAIFGVALAWAGSSNGVRAVAAPIFAALGAASMVVTVLSSVIFPHFNPEHVAPLREFVWPWWRDGITPYSFGLRWFGLRGHADQVAVLAALSVLVLYVLAVGAGAWRDPIRKWWIPVVSVLSMAAIIAGCLWIGSRAKGLHENQAAAGAANTWTKTIWYPPIPPSLLRSR